MVLRLCFHLNSFITVILQILFTIFELLLLFVAFPMSLRIAD